MVGTPLAFGFAAVCLISTATFCASVQADTAKFKENPPSIDLGGNVFTASQVGDGEGALCRKGDPKLDMLGIVEKMLNEADVSVYSAFKLVESTERQLVELLKQKTALADELLAKGAFEQFTSESASLDAEISAQEARLKQRKAVERLFDFVASDVKKVGLQSYREDLERITQIISEFPQSDQRRLDELSIELAFWAKSEGYLDRYPFGIEVFAVSNKGTKISPMTWRETKAYFSDWTGRKKISHEDPTKPEPTNLFAKLIVDPRYIQSEQNNDSIGANGASPTDEIDDLRLIRLACNPKDPDAWIKKVKNSLVFRKTPQDLLKDRKDADGGTLSWSRSRSIDEKTNEETGETEIVRTVDDEYSFEGTLGVKTPWLNILGAQESLVYAHYSHDDDDTRVDGVNEDKAKCLEENAEVEPFKSVPELCDRNKTRVLTLGYIAERKFGRFSLSADGAFVLDIHNNSETARVRGVADFKNAVELCQDTELLKGLIFSCNPSLIGEAAWIIDAGDNTELQELQADLNDPNGGIIDDSGQYAGIGAMIEGQLRFLEKLTLKAGYRYLAVPGARIEDQNLFEASLQLSLDKKDHWALEISRTDGDDVDDFSNRNKWEFGITSKF